MTTEKPNHRLVDLGPAHYDRYAIQYIAGHARHTGEPVWVTESKHYDLSHVKHQFEKIKAQAAGDWPKVLEETAIDRATLRDNTFQNGPGISL